MKADSQAMSNGAFAAFHLPAFAPARTGPRIVAIEGPNGAGKTTLSWALSRRLGVPWCLGTDEAWAADNLKVRMIRDAEWFASAMFFLSGCFEQTRLLRQRSDSSIIMDRSLWSSLAVHAAANPARLGVLVDMLRPIAAEVHIPHLTIVLEASFSTCQARISNKTGTARALDQLTATTDFHSNESRFYHWLAHQSSTIVFLDADRAGADEVAEIALSLLKSKTPGA